MDKEDVVCMYVYIYNGILLSQKKEQNLAMGGARQYYAK